MSGSLVGEDGRTGKTRSPRGVTGQQRTKKAMKIQPGRSSTASSRYWAALNKAKPT